MRKLVFVFGLFLCSQLLFSQTKLIAHKRHSGSDFAFALKNNTADIKDSNFGEAPTARIRNAQLDSVIFIDNEKAVMVTSNYCRENFKRNTKDSISFWRAGKDTVYNHVLFSKKHQLDSIKQVLKTEYNFKNDIEKVVFVGYDNQKTLSKKKKKQFVPPVIINTKSKNKDTNKPFLLYGMSLGLSFLVAVLVYFFFTKRNKRIRYV